MGRDWLFEVPWGIIKVLLHCCTAAEVVMKPNELLVITSWTLSASTVSAGVQKGENDASAGEAEGRGAEEGEPQG